MEQKLALFKENDLLVLELVKEFVIESVALESTVQFELKGLDERGV